VFVTVRDVDTFRQFVTQKCVRPPVYQRRVEAIAAVELLGTIEELGDRTLALARQERLSLREAEELLAALGCCFADPINSAAQVNQIAEELRRLES